LQTQARQVPLGFMCGRHRPVHVMPRPINKTFFLSWQQDLVDKKTSLVLQGRSVAPCIPSVFAHILNHDDNHGANPRPRVLPKFHSPTSCNPFANPS